MSRKRWLLRISRSTPTGREDGFSLALVVLAALMLTAGGLALANRSSQGLLGSVFLGFGLQAREAAEIGATRIVTELNKPQNRGLLRARGTTAETTAWFVSDLASFHRSKCPGSGSSDLATNTSIGAPGSGNSYNQVFIFADGSVGSSRIRNGETATRAYRLLAVSRRPESELTIFQAINPPNGELGLDVEGVALRPDGSVISQIRLRKDYQVVPKCCGVSFGGSHGNVSYATNATTSANLCLNQNTMLGLGFLGGTGDSTGTIELGGSSTVEELSTGTVPIYIPEIFCLADANGTCNSTNVSSSQQQISVNLINPRPADFPVAKEFPAALVPQLQLNSVPGTLSRPNWNANINQFIGCYRDGLADATDPDPATVATNGRKCSVWTINASANNLPGYCARDPLTAETHCVVRRITLKSSDLVVITGSSRLRLYFSEPSNGANDYLIDGFQGSNAIHHCREVGFDLAGNRPYCTVPAASTRDLALFGCNVTHSDGSSHPTGTYPYSDCAAPGIQNIRLVGGAGSLDMFAYFPNGHVQFYGNTFFQGVVWANKITATGSVRWIVPGAGLSEVMVYMGLLPGSNTTTTRNPILFDYIARSSNRFRWVGR